MKIRIGSEIKAIAWDFDGTIINSFNIVKEIVTDICKDEGFAVPDEHTFVTNFHGTMYETLHALLGGNLTDEALESYMKIFLDRQVIYYESITEHLIEDAMALLERAGKAGLKQVLVTNRIAANHGNASPHYIVASSVLKKYIHHVLAGDEVKYRKPDARVLDDYLKEHKLKPREVLVIGDQFVDAQLAMNLGTRAILVHRYGDAIANLDQLGGGWEKRVTIVPDLHSVEI